MSDKGVAKFDLLASRPAGFGGPVRFVLGASPMTAALVFLAVFFRPTPQEFPPVVQEKPAQSGYFALSLDLLG